MSIMLITHDLGVVAEMADYVVVMYAGKIVEKGSVNDIFEHPTHPYTIGLLKSKPVIGKRTITAPVFHPGQVPNPINMPENCYFNERCEFCTEQCKQEAASAERNQRRAFCCLLGESVRGCLHG